MGHVTRFVQLAGRRQLRPTCRAEHRGDTHASLALATEAVTSATSREAQWHQALDSRDVIGRAKGILTGWRCLSAKKAFDGLREASHRLNVKLVQIGEIVATRPDVPD